jgi:transposase
MEGRTPVLKKSRWLLLKREEDLKTEQRVRRRDLLRYNLRTVRAYLLKEAFQQLWDYNSPAWAGKFLDERCRQTMRSRIGPMKKIARLPHLPRSRTRSLSLTWQVARTGVHPRFLLTS